MFRVGQKVVLVNTEPSLGEPFNELEKGKVYTVTRTGLIHPRDMDRLPCISIAEYRAPNAFWAHRFRPVVDRKTSIAIFQAMLNPSLEDMREIIRESANAT
jgi:hypothetical protein